MLLNQKVRRRKRKRKHHSGVASEKTFSKFKRAAAAARRQSKRFDRNFGGSAKHSRQVAANVPQAPANSLSLAEHEQPNAEANDYNELVDVRPSKHNDTEIPQPAAVKKGYAPKHPFRLVVTGESGSGKTTVACHLLEKMYKNYFHKIDFFSPTVKSDPSWSCIDFEDNDRIKVHEELDIEELAAIYDEAHSKVEQHKQGNKGTEKSMSMKDTERRLIVLDDTIANRRFMMSPELLLFFIRGRHDNISIMLLTQSYMKCERSCRINATDIIFFPGNMSEVDRISKEMCPPNCSTKEFQRLVQFTTQKKYDFLFIKRREEPTKRFRRNFKDIVIPPSLQSARPSEGQVHEQVPQAGFGQEKEQDLPLQ